MNRVIQSLFAILILTTSAIYANVGPPPFPEGPFPLAPPLEPVTPSRLTLDSPSRIDIAPPPVLEAKSPVPLVIAGLAATAGVALVGIYLANRGRSGNDQDQ